MLSIFQWAIKFDFPAIFQMFFQFMSSIFDKLSPLPPKKINKRFKICLESFFESIPKQKTLSEF